MTTVQTGVPMAVLIIGILTVIIAVAGISRAAGLTAFRAHAGVEAGSRMPLPIIRFSAFCAYMPMGICIRFEIRIIDRVI